LSKIHSSKSINGNRVDGLDGVCGRYFHDCHRRHTQLEELKVLLRTPKGKSQNDLYEGPPLKTFRASKFKRLSTMIAIDTEW